MYEALIGRLPATEITLHNPKLNLSLIPSSSSLAGAPIEMVSLPNRERLLIQALTPINGLYDYILIDCPPSLGLLTLNGLLAASNGVIIPVQCEYLALEGLTQLMHTLRRVQSHLYPGLSIRGLLLTMYDRRTNLAKEVATEVRRHFPGKVFQTIIPRSVRIAEAPSHGLPISAYDPTSQAAIAYHTLAREVLRGDGLRLPELMSNAEE
jgi:chromosome partitioning protein